MSSDYRHECQDCEKDWSYEEIKPIKHLNHRVDPGETMPSGECPDCGALTHRIKYYKLLVRELRTYVTNYTVRASSIEEARNRAADGDTVEEAHIRHEGAVYRELLSGPEPTDTPVERVSLMPGLDTPDGEKRVNEALRRRNELDYECFQMLRDLIDHYGEKLSGLLPSQRLEDMRKARELIVKREKASHEFLFEVGHAAAKESHDNQG